MVFRHPDHLVFVLQYTDFAVLFTAGDVIDLPLQGPALDATDHIDDLKPAFGERVFGFDRKCSCINIPCEDPFVFEFLEPL